MSTAEQEAYLFATIFSISNKLQVLGDRLDTNITIKQWLFLVCVSKFSQPPTISEVANFSGYSRQNAKRMATTLHQSGYVILTKDRHDARAWRIQLTPQSRGYLESHPPGETGLLEKIFAGLDAGLILALSTGLDRLEHNLTALTMQADNNTFDS
ncbi:MAG: hypothetical protein VB089_11925 [Anaerolineaceae bacterium]|nr:hypothetical protein [Anaerolineaceae bacterium]